MIEAVDQIEAVDHNVDHNVDRNVHRNIDRNVDRNVDHNVNRMFQRSRLWTNELNESADWSVKAILGIPSINLKTEYINRSSMFY